MVLTIINQLPSIKKFSLEEIVNKHVSEFVSDSELKPIQSHIKQWNKIILFKTVPFPGFV